MTTTDSDYSAEVLATVERVGTRTASFGKNKDDPEGILYSATDIAIMTAEAAGKTLPTSRQFSSEAARLSGTGYTVGKTKKALRQLLSEDKIAAFTGDFLKSNGDGYSRVSGGTYYTSVEGGDLLRAKYTARGDNKRDAKAEAAAHQAVLLKYADEVAALKAEMLAAGKAKADEGKS